MRIASLFSMNLSRLFHCSVIKVLCCCLCDSFYILSKAFVFVNNFFIFLCCRFKRQPVYPITGDRLCQQLFSFHPEVFSRADCRIPCRLSSLLFLLYVPPHQRQLAYNSTAASRSQHISDGFVEVGHLPLFTVIVWIVPIISTILVYAENLTY